MNCVIKGRFETNITCGEAIEKAEKCIEQTIDEPVLPCAEVINALDALGARLLTDDEFLLDALIKYGLTRQEALETKKGARSVLEKSALQTKCRRELGSPCGEICRVSPREDGFEGNMPLGVLGHVTSGNDPMLPFFSAVEGLLTGNINLIKPATGADAIVSELCVALSEIAPRLSDYLFVLPISSRNEDDLKRLFSLCDAVAVWGSNTATEGVKKLVAPGTRVIEWGHRISFAYVTRNGESQKRLEEICADVCVNNQLACSAPQIVYYEAGDNEELALFARRFYLAMQKVSAAYPLPVIPSDSRAELTSMTLMEKMRELMNDGQVLEGEHFRIFVRYNETFEASPLYRTVFIKPLPRQRLIGVLRPFRANLQTCALVCALDETVELAGKLYAAGVNRVVSAGQMADGYPGEPHDGVYAMARYVKRVQIRSTDFPRGMMGLNELKPQGRPPFEPGTPVLKKENFKASAEPDQPGQLVLKSGGSSGKSVYAPHLYPDAENTYRMAAQSFFAAGLDPQHDRVMNLFYAGDLYGGFISIYEAIKKLETTQMPMCANMDFAHVAQEIISLRVNVLCGMSTYLIRLLSQEHDVLKAYGGIEKVFYGGEHFDNEQARQLKESLGIREIRSLTYGCNELGTIGYPCQACEGSVHHLVTDTKYMEILKLDSDEPVSSGETGRIVISSRDENLRVDRYEIGDLGRWVEGDCPCGRKTPRFELLGRFGDIFKFATNYINIGALKRVLSNTFDYHGPVQVLLDYQGNSRMTLCVDETLDAERTLQALRDNCPEIAETLRDHTGVISVQPMSIESFIVSEHGGKIRPVVDRRNQ